MTASRTIAPRLVWAGRVLKAGTVGRGLAVWLTGTLGAALVLFAVDNLVRLPAGLRLASAVAVAGLAGLGFVTRVLRPLVRRQTPQRTALALERRLGVRENLLINACQFEGGQPDPAETPFVARTLRRARARCGRLRSGVLWDRRPVKRWAAAGGVALLLWLAYVGFLPRYAHNAWTRFARPLADVPPAGRVVLTVDPVEDLVVAEGEDLTVRARVGGASAESQDADRAPVIAWQPEAGYLEAVRPAAEEAVMTPRAHGADAYLYTFPAVRGSFAFRVFAADTYSPSVRVTVRPIPRVREGLFRVAGPAYTGRELQTEPGPSSAGPVCVSALPGARVSVQVAFDRPVAEAVWRVNGTDVPLARAEQTQAWSAAADVPPAGPYALRVRAPGMTAARPTAEGSVELAVDRPPEVRFVTEDLNRYVVPGTEVALPIEAGDDLGLRSLGVTARRVGAQDAADLSAWEYVGPPGPTGPVSERAVFRVDPRRFTPGQAYLVEAVARDWRPEGAPARSRPVVLRVKDWASLDPPRDAGLAAAFEHLRTAVAEQRQANATCQTLATHLEEVLGKGTLARHRRLLEKRQTAARDAAGRALEAFARDREGEGYRLAARLRPVVEGEMPRVLADLEALRGDKADAPAKVLGPVRERQEYILAMLVALLGEVSAEGREASASAGHGAPDAPAPLVSAEDAARELSEDLKDFTRDQRRILERSRSLLEEGPQALTEEEELVLGELAREEAAWASYFEEKLTDFSKLPFQDFADGTVIEEFNELYMEVKLAAKELYEKPHNLAVPAEQAGLEGAEELVHNLEKWLPDTPDYQKWEMEEPAVPPDVPLAELPEELEDIVGDLLDAESALAEDVEDVTSSWIDSLDKGAGWGAADGPISNMSAKGVTGNRLPNENEIAGRSGEGRTGRSHGQMVEATAQGKGGRSTPTRLTPSPFETGTVEDASTQDPGGATGGGKLSGFAEEGLEGPVPAPLAQKLARLAQAQAQIRQQATEVALLLRRHHLPSGDLESSARAMERVEASARAGQGLAVRQNYHRAVDALEGARRQLDGARGLQRERTRLPESVRRDLLSGRSERVPAGYEEMVSAYFRALAEQPDLTGAK